VPTTPNPQDQPPSKPWPAGGVGGPSGRAAPNAEQVREQTRLFLVLLLGMIVVQLLPMPFRLGGLVLALGIGWVGIRLLIGMSALSRTGAKVRGWPSVIIGLGLAVLLAFVLIGEIAIYSIIVDQERCLAGANTLKARANCEQIYQEQIKQRTTDLFGRTL
jgi:hypothetical protein